MMSPDSGRKATPSREGCAMVAMTVGVGLAKSVF